jgi:hypothetical protein
MKYRPLPSGDQRALLAPPSETASRRGAILAFRSAIHSDIEALLAGKSIVRTL